MRETVRLRIHVAEPFDFERENGSSDLFGTTADHLNDDADEWLIELEGWFRFNECDYDQILIAPRYVSEHLSRVFDHFIGFPIRIAHRTPDGWHFAMTGMVSVAPLADDDEDDEDDGPQGHGSNEDLI